jgi:hypothetical protein
MFIIPLTTLADLSDVKWGHMPIREAATFITCCDFRAACPCSFRGRKFLPGLEIASD